MVRSFVSESIQYPKEENQNIKHPKKTKIQNLEKLKSVFNP
jgi:hypothetical protein